MSSIETFSTGFVEGEKLSENPEFGITMYIKGTILRHKSTSKGVM